MLKSITLHTIDKIFAETEAPIGSLAKMLYLNCLMHHFRNLEPTASNSVAFEIPIMDIPNYKRYEILFDELMKAGLVEIRPLSIFFVNHWGSHIDKMDFQKTPNDVVVGLHFTNAEQVIKEIVENDYLFELLAMRHKFKREQFEKLVKMFVTEQIAFGKKYYNVNDMLKHFTFWIPQNHQRGSVEKKQNKLLGE